MIQLLMVDAANFNS